jgi:hypothetical protein
MDDEEITKHLVKQIERDLWTALLGGPLKQKRTALRHRNGSFEVVELNDDGFVIEPAPRCPFCGPVMLCSKHMALVS